MSKQIVPISALQAEALQLSRTTIAARESTIESQQRRQQDLVRESPAVAETFMRLRRAEDLSFQQKKLRAAQMNHRKKEAAEAIAARRAAVADLKRATRSIQDLESTRACKQAVNTLFLDALGAGSANAGGVRVRKKTVRASGPPVTP